MQWINEYEYNYFSNIFYFEISLLVGEDGYNDISSNFICYTQKALKSESFHYFILFIKLSIYHFTEK